ncbi:MAG: zinc ABC transporter substrate-binding protein [Victivallaceae bacterium]|nr:zinc ABC transporter substrate-binding protein [Victivallaceae bacterium]
MKSLYVFFSFILLILVIAGCSEQQPESQATGKMIVFAGIPPISNIAEAIGGKYIAVKTLLPPGQSPHSFTPRPGMVKELGLAKLYISIDMPFEHNIIVPLMKKSDIQLCAADAGIKKISISGQHHHDKADEHKEHEPAEADHDKPVAHPDPHIWLSTVNDLIIARNITTALCQIDPPNAGTYRSNLAAFTREITKIKAELERVLAPFKGQTFYVYHPSFGYFAQEFGLKQEAVEHDGKQPMPKELATLIENAKHDGIKFIFVQPQFSKRSAEIIATQIGAQVIRLDPLSADLLGNYLKIAESIKQSMDKEQQ